MRPPTETRNEHDDHPLTFSKGWFVNFQKRHDISVRAVTSSTNVSADEKVAQIQSFHRFIRRNAMRGVSTEKKQAKALGNWKPEAIANMDQTPMPFVFGGGKTNAKKESKRVWVRGGQS